jgi:hypothetical protein
MFGTRLDGSELKTSFWKILFVSSIVVTLLGVYMLGNLDVKISGDGIPNNSAGEPFWEYLNRETPLIVLTSLSGAIALFSMIKVFRRS